ncbi:OmpA family protein [Acidovorax kalamii]|uniref:OmpA family protein n=1 Tax=Acidovorax kalamii TaxID=2004485 RepID=UPI0020906933|nr:OmpA family protein [Acidovorax kalamii]MCO5356029.1 OmpA family protein [Acidovorax kalamii]
MLFILRTFTQSMLLAIALVPSFSWAYSATIAADVFFEPGSSVLHGEQIDQLDRLKCRVGTTSVDVLVVVGNASSRERNAQTLALARALAVKQWFADNTEWGATRVHAEGRGASWPVADNETDEGSAKNRRVEMEVVSSVTRPRYSSHCSDLRWVQSFLALEGDSAMVVARSLARTGWVRVPSLYRIALERQRDDLFTRLPHAGIATPRLQRIEIAKMALAFGKFDYFKNWLRSEGRSLEGAQRDALLKGACEGEGSVLERAAVIRMLHAAGAVSRTREGLQCAVMHRSAPVVEAYLAGGAQRFIDADLVVEAGGSPEVLDRLLAWGGNLASRTVHGTTLFHTSRLRTVADVQRLLDGGLDINAKGRTYRSNPETTPLEEAVSYASVEVLDFMKQAGADINGLGPANLQETRIAANQIWMVRNGVPIPKVAEAVVHVARQGEVALPVLEAMHERGLDLGGTTAWGESALGIAISMYEPAVVRFLVERSVPLQVRMNRMNREAPVRPALEAAESLSEVVPPAPCASYGVCPTALPYPPVVDLERQRKKNEILQILRTGRP